MRGRWHSTTGEDSYRFFSPEQVDKILSEGAKRGRAGSHAAIERILKLEPGVEQQNSGNEYVCSNAPRAGLVTSGVCGAPRMIRSSLGGMKEVG